MTKLSAIDASFIYAETDASPMSIASLQFLQLPNGVGVEEFVRTLRDYISKRAHLVPYLTSRVQWSSGMLDHPNWVHDPDFDISKHIYAVEVPAPGGLRQVEQTVARLHETPLPRHRPLWDMVVLTGLKNGNVAYYNRVHHACIDGVAAQAAYNVLMDQDPNNPNPQSITSAPRKPRSLSEHTIGLLTSMAKQSIDQAALAPARAAAVTRLWQRSLSADEGLGATLQTCPPTPFNKSIDRGRVWAAGELPLPGTKKMAKQLNCTINDIFLAVCGGALRRYLEHHNALPQDSLIAGCPVSLRLADDATNNNQVSMMRVALGSHIDDPVARVDYVRRSATSAKGTMADAAALMPREVSLPMLGMAIRSMQTIAGLSRTAEHRVPAMNVLISNVPGPQQALFSNGARMLSHYPISIPNHGIGINITVQSYIDTLYVGITAAARLAPDVDRLRDDIHSEFAALHNAISAEILELSPPKETISASREVPEVPEKPNAEGLPGKVA